MEKFNVYLETETLRKLRVIRDVSLGKPDVSSLIRQAIEGFIDAQKTNPVIKRALERDTTPRLIRTGTQASADADDSQG